MKSLGREKRAKVLHMLCEGSSINSICRIEKVGKNTVLRLLADAGKACMEYHHEHVRNVKAERVRVDEIWTFTHCKQRTVPFAKRAPEFAGDTWTWTAIDADSKLIVSYLVGERNLEHALEFISRYREAG